MIHPSYSELTQAINTNNDEDNTILVNSRYSLVIATSKRARQIIAGSEPLVPGAAGKKPLSVAIDELYKGKVKILADKTEEEEEVTAQEPQEAAEETSEETAQEVAGEETAEEETAEQEENTSEEEA